MWFFPTKKEVNKELDKIKEGFKERDLEINKLKDKIENNSLKIATLEGSFLIMSQRSLSHSQSSLKQSQTNRDTFETKIIKNIRKNKKSLVMAEILKYIETLSTIEIFNKLVKEKGLCSKASFYRYISGLKSQGLETLETNEILINTK